MVQSGLDSDQVVVKREMAQSEALDRVPDPVVVKKEVVEEDKQGDESFQSVNEFLSPTRFWNTHWNPSPSAPSFFSMVGPNHARTSVRSSKLEKYVSNGLNSHGVDKSTMIIAGEFQSGLGTEVPSFVKLLVRSNVSSGFWMGLPGYFCKSYLPKRDATVILEDESGEEFELKFISQKTGLSAGWKNFATGHKLLEGDALVFQLVEATKFKVYIIRANNSTAVDGSFGLLNLDTQRKENDSEKDDQETETTVLSKKKREHPNSQPSAMVQKKHKKLSRSVRKLVLPVEESENGSDTIGPEVLVGSKFSGSAVEFGGVKSFEDFNILVNGLCIDPELPEHIRTKYYELCCSKKAFLHARLLQHLNCRLVAGVIFETVNIADALRACKLSTSQEQFATWGDTLKSFELLGMDVGFLLARLHQLQTLAYESEDASDAKRYMEAKVERVEAENEIKILEAKLVEMKETFEKIDADIKALKSKAESHILKFQDEIEAPW